ncbi:MAG: ATP-binding cassette domain-containing protein [Lachnospiraceae bacterium]|nr:ATP-binding cassette domain-containing protein [Lachnospiraceae bacterium]
MPVEMKHIWKSYGEQKVLADFSLTIKEGEKVCLMGASGIGKTTVLSILAGLVRPDAGEVTGIKGKKLSMVFQEDRLIEWADAFENVALVLEQKKSQALWDFLRGEFDAVGLQDYEGKPVAQLSGGMKRRVALVRAVCARGEFLLLDEPFTGLDQGTKEQVAGYLNSRTAKNTVVMVAHDIQDAECLGARIVLCKK